MNALTALPFEIQDYIYAFDGRYKTAMNQCVVLVEEWGKTAVHGKYSWASDSPIVLESDRRAKIYSRHLGDDDVIRLRHKVIDTTIGRDPGYHDSFKDVFGLYTIMAKQKSIWVDGEKYKSTKYYKFVGFWGTSRKCELNKAIGTPTRESRFYLLDPEFQKKLRQSKDPVSAFLKHGLSPKGKRSKIVFK
jgi:hypothetical protein